MNSTPHVICLLGCRFVHPAQSATFSFQTGVALRAPYRLSIGPGSGEVFDDLIVNSVMVDRKPCFEQSLLPSERLPAVSCGVMARHLVGGREGLLPFAGPDLPRGGLVEVALFNTSMASVNVVLAFIGELADTPHEKDSPS